MDEVKWLSHLWRNHGVVRVKGRWDGGSFVYKERPNMCQAHGAYCHETEEAALDNAIELAENMEKSLVKQRRDVERCLEQLRNRKEELKTAPNMNRVWR